jgi:hypothetical protein
MTKKMKNNTEKIFIWQEPIPSQMRTPRSNMLMFHAVPMMMNAWPFYYGF